MMGFCVPLFPPEALPGKSEDEDVGMFVEEPGRQDCSANTEAEGSTFSPQSVEWWPERDATERAASTAWPIIGAAKHIVISGDGGPERVRKLNGMLHEKIDTDGDGACALHSVFGCPTLRPPSGRRKLFVTDARAKAVSTLGSTAAEFRRRLRADHLYESIESSLWSDLLLPILYRQLKQKTDLEERTQGRILWSHVKEDANFRKSLEAHVEKETSKRKSADESKKEAFLQFYSLCRQEYNGLWSLTTQIINEESLIWDGDAVPWWEMGGCRLIKGTQKELPTATCPKTMLDALVDERPCFDMIRRGYMECLGGDLHRFQAIVVKVLTEYQPEMLHRREINMFLNALRTAVDNAHGDIKVPQDFMTHVWPHYCSAYQHGGEGRQYWLSYDELLALATIAKVNLVVVEEKEDAFHYVGDNLNHVSRTEDRIAITSIRGGGSSAIESHFERLIPKTGNIIEAHGDDSAGDESKPDKSDPADKENPFDMNAFFGFTLWESSVKIVTTLEF